MTFKCPCRISRITRDCFIHDVRWKNGGDEAVWLRDIREYIRIGILGYRASIECISPLSIPGPRHRSRLGSSV